MARIRIEDLPADAGMSSEEMRRVAGGGASFAIMAGLGPASSDPFESIDTCDTPASAPSVPVPYPNTEGTSGDGSVKVTKNGSGVGGGSIGSSSGDEAG
jgi:hypothetical protein